METKSFLGLDGLNHFWEKAKIWIINEITSKIAEIALSSVPVGTVLSGLYKTVPNGFLLCDGQEVAIESFHKLYAEIGSLACCQSSNTGMFKLPDLRECVMVGAGQSTRAILDEDGHSHDVYALGEFKDDQFQGHVHKILITTSDKYKYEGSAVPTWYGREYLGANDVFGPSSDNINGEPRTGTTTHGKQFGINYIIKY